MGWEWWSLVPGGGGGGGGGSGGLQPWPVTSCTHPLTYSPSSSAFVCSFKCVSSHVETEGLCAESSNLLVSNVQHSQPLKVWTLEAQTITINL